MTRQLDGVFSQEIGSQSKPHEHFHNDIQTERQKSIDNVNSILSLKGDLNIDETSFNSVNNEIWQKYGIINSEQKYEIEGKEYDGISKIYELSNGTIAIVFKYKTTIHGKYAGDGEEKGKNIFKTKDKVKSVINLKTGEIFNSFIDIGKFINENETDKTEADKTLKSVIEIFSKK